MFNFKYLVGGAALVLATSAFAGGPEDAPIAAPAPVASNSGFYINANGGLNLLTNSNFYNNAGWNIGGALGYHFSNNIRVEVADNYWRHTVRNRFAPFPAFQINTLMGNVYYDFDFGSSFVPYIGAGAGWAHQWISQNIIQGVNVTASRNQFAFQGIVGVDYKITDNVRIGVSYHALGFAGKNNNNINGNNQLRVSRNLENQINIGLSYYF